MRSGRSGFYSFPVPRAQAAGSPVPFHQEQDTSIHRRTSYSPGPTQAGTQGTPTRLPSRMRLEKFGDKPPSHPAVPIREVPGHFPDSLEKQSSEPDRTRLGARQVSTVGACSFLCLSLFVTYSSQSEAAAAGEVSSTPTPLVISSIRKIANESLQRRMHASGGTHSNKASFDKRCLKRVQRHF